MLLSLFVVNKSGGLIYHRNFSSLAKLDTNDTLRLGVCGKFVRFAIVSVRIVAFLSVSV